MLSQLLEKVTNLSRGQWLWALLPVLVLGQLVAFWMLCSHQVQRAHERDASVQVQRMALADCLSYMPGATTSSCAAQFDSTRDDGRALAARAIGSATLHHVDAVNYVNPARVMTVVFR